MRPTSPPPIAATAACQTRRRNRPGPVLHPSAPSTCFRYFISPNVYATNANWGVEAGPVLRF
ncbi:MAG TPA: hypothetical protein VMD55_11880 [Terracidiphilus sp.]|nr:hypothetical protein [Terracidiphilus sp.]